MTAKSNNPGNRAGPPGQTKPSERWDGRSLNESGGNRDKEHDLTHISEIKATGLWGRILFRQREEVNHDLEGLTQRLSEDSWMMDKEWFAQKYREPKEIEFLPNKLLPNLVLNVTLKRNILSGYLLNKFVFQLLIHIGRENLSLSIWTSLFQMQMDFGYEFFMQIRTGMDKCYSLPEITWRLFI